MEGRNISRLSPPNRRSSSYRRGDFGQVPLSRPPEIQFSYIAVFRSKTEGRYSIQNNSHSLWARRVECHRAAEVGCRLSVGPKEVNLRTVTFGGANSLDNYLARRDHGVDWLMWGKEVAEITASYWRTIDTVLMGRKTFEVAVRSGQKHGYPGVKNYVFSRTIERIEGPITLVSEDAAQFVQRLKEDPGKGICVMGGGELARSLFEADLIDEIGFNIHPVLLGSGVPLFHPMSHQINLELKECRALKNGCVYVTYRINHSETQ